MRFITIQKHFRINVRANELCSRPRIKITNTKIVRHRQILSCVDGIDKETVFTTKILRWLCLLNIEYV